MNAVYRLKRVLTPIIREPIITLLVFLLVVLLTVFVIAISSKQPQWIYDLLGIVSIGEPKYEALKFLGISMGGILIALQALMSYRRAKALEDTARAQADAVLRTEDGQRQDRLKNAIEHLGHGSESVRLGGAYELFHLAEDTKELRQTVIDILCAHIRQTTVEPQYRKTHEWKPSEQVQSLLTLLFMQEHGLFRGLRVNLQESWLNGVDLRDAYMERAVFTKAYLRGAILDSAHLQEANFREAHLQGAVVSSAHLQAVDFIEAHLQGADLFGANLLGAQLFGANLQGVNLHAASLQGARLGGARLQGANLSFAHLEGVNSHFANEAFADRIRKLVGKKTELVGVILAGELSEEEIDSIVKDLPDEAATDLQKKLVPHIDKPESSELPPGCGHVITGSYAREEAEKWIAEYEKAMPKVPEEGSRG